LAKATSRSSKGSRREVKATRSKAAAKEAGSTSRSKAASKSKAAPKRKSSPPAAAPKRQVVPPKVVPPKVVAPAPSKVVAVPVKPATASAPPPPPQRAPAAPPDQKAAAAATPPPEEPKVEVGEKRRSGNGAKAAAAIRIVELTKAFGPQTIFENVSFDIPKGEISIILGPSGTGKSVFLKHLVGLLKPDKGEVWIGDYNVPALSEKELYEVRKKFGVLFQDGALFGSMNIYDNTAFPLREHTKKSESEIRQIVGEKLGMVGLQGAEKKLPGEISGGMKKRAGLARALVLDPEIILFDEPDSGLDPVRTAFLCQLIVDLKKELGSTMIVVTHHIPSAQQIADYIGLLFRRNLVTFGPAADMFASKHPVVKQFLSGAIEGPIGMSEEKDQPGEQSSGAPASGVRQPAPAAK
jgi:phospholipid/cholesterol/gamma-HCH transport system ATP-binding protein